MYIVVVVVFDGDTFYWVYSSSDQPFQVYYKVAQVSLQTATADFITKCDSLLVRQQEPTNFDGLLATGIIVCDDYYKLRHNTHV